MAATASHRSRNKRTSLLADLLTALPQLRPQVYFKSSLVALSHAMEDQVLAGQGNPIVIANFQKERYYRQEARRYRRISGLAKQVYVLALPETGFHLQSTPYETIALDPEDPLTQEWHLIVIDDSYATCLICRERKAHMTNPLGSLAERDMDPARQFEGIWSFDRTVAIRALEAIIPKILSYRRDLRAELQQVRRDLVATLPESNANPDLASLNPAPFAERLITYLQAGQYKLQRTYKAIQLQERKERLVNTISSTIRRSLDPRDILATAVTELGQAAGVSRCLVYRCKADQPHVRIEYEYCQAHSPSLKDQQWPLAENPFLLTAMQQGEPLHSETVSTDPHLESIAPIWQEAQIQAWLVVPILYQGKLLGMLELHQDHPQPWPLPILELAESIALQVGIALIQAEAYQHLDELNHQLEALDQAKTDLIAVTGHELRTPLSTILVCLESLASEPEMPAEIRQEMLNTALDDTQRLRQLVQDFLTLSKLESGRIRWHFEPVSPEECVELAVSYVNVRRRIEVLPPIMLDIPAGLPMVRADGEWLVEVLRQLLDNACKFTPATGQVWVRLLPIHRCDIPKSSGARANGLAARSSTLPIQAIQFTVADSGRGIEANRLQAIFDRFYQVENSLRRSVSGTGLGLAICRLIVEGMGGRIWAESPGLEQGSSFHFTLPILAPSRSLTSSTVPRQRRR